MDILKKTSLDTKATTGANYDTVMEEVKKSGASYEEKEYEFERKSEEIAVLKEVINRTTADIEARLYDIERRLSAIETELKIKPSSEPGEILPLRRTPEAQSRPENKDGPAPGRLRPRTSMPPATRSSKIRTMTEPSVT